MSSILIFLMVTPIQAQTPKRNWDAEYEQLLAADTKYAEEKKKKNNDWFLGEIYAKRLKYSDGTWVQPKPNILALLKTLKPAIEEAAKAMDVDPRAIAGAIIAENTMNVGVSDAVQDWLVQAGLADKGTIGGKPFTFGIGQLHFQVAREAEILAATIEKRKPLNDKELQEALKDPKQAVKQTAQVLRKIQDEYKKQGIDISKNPGVLTTVYNLGGEEKRALAAKAQNRLPAVNFFGFFVEKNMPKIEGVVGKPQAAPTVVPPPAPVVIAKNKTTVPAKTNTTPKVKVPEKKLVKLQVLSTSIPLVQSPPTCDLSGDGNDLNRRYETYKNYAVSASADKGSTWKMLAPTIDCEAQKWFLIRTDSNTVGWAKVEDLEKATVEEYREEKVCASKEDSKCRIDVEKTTKDFLPKKEEIVTKADQSDSPVTAATTTTSNVVEAEKTKLTYLHPFSSNGKANFKNRNNNCPPPIQKTVDEVVATTGTAVSANTSLPASSTNSTAVVGGGSNGGVPNGSTTGTGTNTSTTAGISLPAAQHVPLPDNRLVATSPRQKNIINDLENVYKLAEKKLKPFGDTDDPNNPYSIASDGYMVSPQSILDKIRLCINQEKSKNPSCDISTIFVYNLNQLDYKKKPTLAQASSSMSTIVNLYNLINPYGFRADNLTSWAATDEEIEKIDQKESIKLLESCQTKFKGKNLYSSDSILAKAIQDSKTLSNEDWKINDAARYNSANLIKLCADTLDLFFDDKIKSDKEKTLCSVKTSEMQMRNMKVISKNLVKQYYSTPQAIDQNFIESIAPYLADVNPSATKVLLALVNQQAQQQAMQQRQSSWRRGYGDDYCPNLTAQYIEELLEKHPCIKKIYVPDLWLLSRLNQVQSKIVYRPFEKDDVYAIDYTETSCK